MNWFSSITRFVTDGIADIRASVGAKIRRDKRPRVAYQLVEEFPERLLPNALYIVGEQPFFWAAAIICPCGCGETIHLNLLEQERPCWEVRFHAKGSVSVLPSVWRTKGCRSHFFIRNSQIEWCRLDSAQSSGRHRSR